MPQTKPKNKQSGNSPPLSLEAIKARREAVDAELEAVRVQRQAVDRILAEMSHKAELALLRAELQTELASHHADRAEIAANRANRSAQQAERAKPDYFALLLIAVAVSGLVATSLIVLSRQHHEPTQSVSPSAPAPGA